MIRCLLRFANGTTAIMGLDRLPPEWLVYGSQTGESCYMRHCGRRVLSRSAYELYIEEDYVRCA